MRKRTRDTHAPAHHPQMPCCRRLAPVEPISRALGTEPSALSSARCVTKLLGVALGPDLHPPCLLPSHVARACGALERLQSAIAAPLRGCSPRPTKMNMPSDASFASEKRRVFELNLSLNAVGAYWLLLLLLVVQVLILLVFALPLLRRHGSLGNMCCKWCDPRPAVRLRVLPYEVGRLYLLDD